MLLICETLTPAITEREQVSVKSRPVTRPEAQDTVLVQVMASPKPTAAVLNHRAALWAEVCVFISMVHYKS